MKQDLAIRGQLVIPASALSWSFSRSSGPGGQNVNKVSSKATLNWDPQASNWPDYAIAAVLTRLPKSKVTAEGLVKVSSSETRDQYKNRLDCQDKLVSLVQLALIPKKIRRKTKPSRAAKERRLSEKKRRSDQKSKRSWRASHD